MTQSLTNGRPPIPRWPLDATATFFRAAAPNYRATGSPLYGVLCEATANDPELVVLASQSLTGRPMNLLSAVHDLLLRDPGDPLSRNYATSRPIRHRPNRRLPLLRGSAGAIAPKFSPCSERGPSRRPMWSVAGRSFRRCR